MPEMLKSTNHSKHLSQRQMLILVIYLLLCRAATATNTTTFNGDTDSILKGPIIAKPGCLSKCGNLTIPYPFGVGSDCAMSAAFEITCNSSSPSSSVAFLQTGNIIVYNISDTQLRISTSIAKKCYDESGGVTDNYAGWTMLGPGGPFSYSITNKFTLISCDDIVLMSILSLEGGEQSYVGCAANCSTADEVTKHTGKPCSGVGCCEIPIPKGQRFYNNTFVSFNNHTRVHSFNPCSYAFLGEQSLFKFKGVEDLNDTDNFVSRIRASVQIAVEWEVPNTQDCVNAANDSRNNACKSNNSRCDNTTTGLGGYRCRCDDGYQGNPYLHGGCQDIDECADSPCTFGCINIPGNFTCSCPPGQKGDAKKNGTGCTTPENYSSSEFPVIKFSIETLYFLLK